MTLQERPQASISVRVPHPHPATIRGIRTIASYLGVSHHAVREAVRSGRLPRLAGTGRDTVCLVEDVEAWVRSLRATA